MVAEGHGGGVNLRFDRERSIRKAVVTTIADALW